MKQLCSRLTVWFAILIPGSILGSIPVAGLAQAPQKAVAPTTSAPVVSTQPVNPQPVAASSATGMDHGTDQNTNQTPAVNASAGGPLDPQRYVVGAEDSLQITVWKDPTLSGTVPVRPDGMISMNLIGDLRAAGLTPMALAADISQRLKKYLQDPVVTVVVLGVNSQRIFLVGEVGHVGPVMMTPGMTVLQAIVTAGGLSQFANSKRIYLLRTVAGKQEKIPFNYKQALRGENQGVPLLPGDTIVIP